MKEEVISMLSELRYKINDTIVRVEKESAANSKEIVSIMEEWRKQLDEQIEYWEKIARDRLLDMCDKSVNPEYKPDIQVDIKISVDGIMFKDEANAFVEWMNERGYIQRVNGEWIIISSMVENRKGYFYVNSKMMEAFWLCCRPKGIGG